MKPVADTGRTAEAELTDALAGFIQARERLALAEREHTQAQANERSERKRFGELACAGLKVHHNLEVVVVVSGQRVLVKPDGSSYLVTPLSVDGRHS